MQYCGFYVVARDRHLLPQSLGQWNSVFKRFSRWCKYGVWQFLPAGCSQYLDRQQILIDGPIGRAHACAAERQTVRRRQKPWDARKAASPLKFTL